MPNRLLDCIRRAALLRDGGGLSDGQLLALFVKHRDGDAFAALLKRHGPMVMGVCRRVLLNHHDAEDAFQATFLIFARKAGTVTTQDSIAGWLYRVSYRTALEARVRIARRRSREQQVNELPHTAIEPNEGQGELLVLLDKELDRLPDKYRVPVVLCELEGRSRKEAARVLGVPEGTLSWRLAHAKKLLAKRLSRQGLVISAGTLAAVMAAGTASACLRTSTLKMVLSVGTVPAKVLALTEGVLKAMLLTKLKITVCFAALALVAGIGATGLTYRATAEEPKRPGYGAFTSSAAENRPGADDLDSLRLEIEALRKELRATRERVKTLEDEVRGQKGRNAAQPQQKLPSKAKERGRPEVEKALESARREMEKEMRSAQREIEKKMKSLRGAGQVSDIMSQVEAELQKALEKTNDKQVKEALEKALKKLKAREKTKVPGEDKPREKK
jgi:RNA polymerase sigma factor (sigma-70 family)